MSAVVSNRSEDSLRHALKALLEPEGKTLVEVGCGSGSLSLWFATEGLGKVLAFDVNQTALQEATQNADAKRLRNIIFENCSVYDIPLPEEYADIVICRSLLCVLDRVQEAIKEMTRVVRRGGAVVAIEPALAQLAFDPDDERYSFLSMKLNNAFYEGWRKKGVDQRVGLKVPRFFLKAGLANIMLDGFMQVYLISDYRRSYEDVTAQLETEASQLPKNTDEMLIEGGITREELEEFSSIARSRLSHFSSNPAAMKKSSYARIMSPMVLTMATRV
jgi:ubiquinone/menaquinone biosynthesis C-methylase UbiE